MKSAWTSDRVITLFTILAIVVGADVDLDAVFNCKSRIFKLTNSLFDLSTKT